MDSFGTFLNVWWGVGEDVIVDEEEGETLYPEMVVVPAKIASLSRCLYWMRPEIEWFYIHYAREQGLIGSSD